MRCQLIKVVTLLSLITGVSSQLIGMNLCVDNACSNCISWTANSGSCSYENTITTMSTFTLYSDSSCQSPQSSISITVDGICHQISSSGGSYKATNVSAIIGGVVVVLFLSVKILATLPKLFFSYQPIHSIF